MRAENHQPLRPVRVLQPERLRNEAETPERPAPQTARLGAAPAGGHSPPVDLSAGGIQDEGLPVVAKGEDHPLAGAALADHEDHVRPFRAVEPASHLRREGPPKPHQCGHPARRRIAAVPRSGTLAPRHLEGDLELPGRQIVAPGAHRLSAIRATGQPEHRGEKERDSCRGQKAELVPAARSASRKITRQAVAIIPVSRRTIARAIWVWRSSGRERTSRSPSSWAAAPARTTSASSETTRGRTP